MVSETESSSKGIAGQRVTAMGRICGQVRDRDGRKRRQGGNLCQGSRKLPGPLGPRLMKSHVGHGGVEVQAS